MPDVSDKLICVVCAGDEFRAYDAGEGIALTCITCGQNGGVRKDELIQAADYIRATERF